MTQDSFWFWFWWQDKDWPYTKKLLSKYPSFPRAHHPIVRDSTSMFHFAGLLLVQLGNRSFRDFLSKFVNPGFLQHCSFQSPSSFAEVPNLCTIFPEVTTTNRSRRNRFRNFGSLRKIFIRYHVVEFTTLFTMFEDLLSTAQSLDIRSAPFLLFFHSPLSYCATIQSTVMGEGRRDYS